MMRQMDLLGGTGNEKKERARPMECKFFERFWAVYPKRNGIKVGKKKAKEKFAKLSTAWKSLAIQAAQNYANSERARTGYARDAERFLSNEFWHDWIDQTETKPGLAPMSELSKTRKGKVDLNGME